MTETIVVQAAFDEAGDTGLSRRSSRYLVVAGIVCARLDSLRRAVARTRKSLGGTLRQIPELKAQHSPPWVTALLLQRLAALDDVKFYAAILDKHAAPAVVDPEEWYRQTYTRAVQQALADRKQIIVTMDRRYTKAALQDKLAQTIVAGAQRPGTILSFVYADSRKERALQAADAIAWSVFQKYEREEDSYYRMMASKLKGEILLGG